MTEAKMLDDIDEFIEEHRRKLSEDKKVLSDILNFLEEKQQVLALDNENYSQESRLNEVEEKLSNRVQNYDFISSNLYEDEHPRVMVRYGEFSPLNPVFRSNSRPLLGLGEYEERRKIFLEKKKREYQQYLSKAKNEKDREKVESKLPDDNKNIENHHPRLTNITEPDSAKISQKNLNMSRGVLSPGRGVVEATDRCYARWQQQVYRRELDKQIIDKKKRLKEEKERERLECEKKQKEMMMEQIKLSKSIAEQIRRYQMTEMLRDDAPTDDKENLPINDENEIFIEGVNLPDSSSNPPVCSLGFNPVPNKLLESPPHRTNSSIFNTTSPSKSPEHTPRRVNNSLFNITSTAVRKPTPFPICADVPSKDEHSSQSPTKNFIPESVTVDSPNQQRCSPDVVDSKSERLSKQRSQQEIYKNELARQIEEKKRLEMERKRKEAEEEKRIEEKVRQDEEKLRQEYEKEQAERAYRASQRVQQEVRVQEHLSKLQKEAEERKKNTRQGTNTVAISKPSVYPTNHGVTSKGAMRNVSFAPKACVYSFQNTNGCVQSNDVSSTENQIRDASQSQTILEAPYVLAVKGNEVGHHDYYAENRPPSPPVPAIKTQHMLKSLPKADDDMIPSTVSMSPETREKFLKDAKILSNLSEIRRRLLIKHAGLETQ